MASPRTRAPRVLEKAVHRLRKRAGRALDGFVNGVDWLTRNPSRLVDRTPFDEVLRSGKLAVRRYRPLADRDDDEIAIGTEILRYDRPRPETPVLLVPPLMVKPFVYDLVRERSYVRTLLGAGFDVFLVDFGEPDRADEHVRLDHYVLDWMPRAVDAVLSASGAPGLSMIGYCMGGLFALLYTSVNEDARVRNLVTIAAPVDSHQMGLLAWVVGAAHEQLDRVADRVGNVPGSLSSAAFKLMNPWKNVTRYASLFLNLWDQEYVNGFDAMNQWSENFIDYPKEAFRQFLNDFLKENKLQAGKMVFGDKVADLGRIRCALLAFAGRTDEIVPVSSAKRLLDLVESRDKQFRVVPGGHMGVFAGRGAPKDVWSPSATWLLERSGA